MAALPYYIAAQLRNLLEDARTLATTKRLTHAYEMELFSLDRAVTEAVETQSDELGRAALAQARRLLQQLQEAPDKSGGGLLVR